MKDLERQLTKWWESHHRVLPWRIDPTPYHVWLSEIMLQQTRVETVKSYYLRFLDALPTIKDLAEAPEDTYLKLWEGLGYYSRVRNLHKAAVQVMEDHNGELPSTKEELLHLSGIGEYTASAIASIAFHEKEIAVDGNLIRIYARLFALPLDPKAASTRKEVTKGFLEELEGDPAIFNQALMELGQTICLPNGKPLCEDCPLRAYCKAHQKGEETLYPLFAKKTKQRVERKTMLIIENEDGIEIRKRPDTGLLASLYEIPNYEGHLSEIEIHALLEKEGYQIESIDELGTAKHVFSHIVWEMIGYRVVARNSKVSFLAREKIAKEYSIPTAFSYFM